MKKHFYIIASIALVFSLIACFDDEDKFYDPNRNSFCVSPCMTEDFAKYYQIHVEYEISESTGRIISKSSIVDRLDSIPQLNYPCTISVKYNYQQIAPVDTSIIYPDIQFGPVITVTTPRDFQVLSRAHEYKKIRLNAIASVLAESNEYKISINKKGYITELEE